jgi:hypothetical protein
MVGDFNYINELFNNPNIGVAVNSTHGHLEGVVSFPKSSKQEFKDFEDFLKSRNIECELHEFVSDNEKPAYAKKDQNAMLNFDIITLNRSALKKCPELDWPNKENYQSANSTKEDFAASNISYAIQKGKIELSYSNIYSEKHKENIKQLILQPKCDLDIHLYLCKVGLSFNLKPHEHGNVMIRNNSKGGTVFYLDEKAIQTFLSFVIPIEKLPEFKNKDDLVKNFEKAVIPAAVSSEIDELLKKVLVVASKEAGK